MHDHLRDLRREIANQRSPYHLWFQGQVIEIQPQQEGVRIRGIVNATGDSCYSSQGKIIINTSQGSRAFKPCSLGLKILVDSWDTEANPPLQLRELIINNCGVFRGFPQSIGRLVHRKEMKAKSKSSEMRSLPREFCFLQSLEFLKLSRCRNLSYLPSDFGELTNLQHLDLSYCSQVRSLPVSFKQLTLLQYFNLEECVELTVESDKLDLLEDMTKFKYLNFNGCSKLENLPLTNGASLTELYLERTSLGEFPDKIGQLSKLSALEISSDSLTALPSFIGNLSSLNSLKIKKCQNLKYLPVSLETLSSFNFTPYLSLPQTGMFTRFSRAS
ncbi:hypothetical protein SUGI_0679900 [Cryptomeria japonica]|nr:hypothetical protein SUGI_0679900 [Cryptomeria japonica]